MSQPIEITGSRGAKVILQARDFNLLTEVFDNRFIDIQHAADLHYGSEDIAKRRLRQLATAGLLKPQDTGRENPKVLYRQTRKMLDVLMEQGVVQPPDQEWLAKQRKRSAARIAKATLDHQLAVLDVKSALQPSLNDTPHLRVIEFGIWPQAYRFPRPPGSKVRELEPDGYLHVRQHSPSHDPLDVHFYLELDQGGNEPLDRLLEKVDAYQHHLKSGGFAAWLGIPGAPREVATFRVLIVVSSADSERRCANICRHLAENRPQLNSLVWLTTLAALQQAPLGPVWMTPAMCRTAQENGTEANGERLALF